MRSTSTGVAIAYFVENTCLRDKMARPQSPSPQNGFYAIGKGGEQPMNNCGATSNNRSFISIIANAARDEHKTRIKHENVEGDEEIEKKKKKKNPLKYYWNWMEWTLEKDIVNHRETWRARLPELPSLAAHATVAFWTIQTATTADAARVHSSLQNDLLKMIKWFSLLELLKEIKIKRTEHNDLRLGKLYTVKMHAPSMWKVSIRTFHTNHWIERLEAEEPNTIRRRTTNEMKNKYVNWSSSIDEGVRLHNGFDIRLKFDDRYIQKNLFFWYRVCRSARRNARTLELIKRYRVLAWQRYNLIVKQYLGRSHACPALAPFEPFIFNQPKNYRRQATEVIIIYACANFAAGAK